MVSGSGAVAQGMRTVAIVQARMSSQRLPGKVLAEIGGQPALGLLLARLSRASVVDDIVVATSDHQSDDPIANFCSDRRFAVHRGPLDDVLERFRQAAEAVAAEVVVRVTGDCPLIDPALVDGLVRFAKGHNLHYAGLGGEFPHGLDCEVFSQAALDDAASAATNPYDREHVTPFMKTHPDKFITLPYQPISGLLCERWTLDFEEDLLFLRQVVGLLGGSAVTAGYVDILHVLEAHTELRGLNRGRASARIAADAPKRHSG